MPSEWSVITSQSSGRASLAGWPEDVITYLLPNIPQTHFVLWGAETVGIANPVNPMLEPETIKDICVAAGTKVLVALGELCFRLERRDEAKVHWTRALEP